MWYTQIRGITFVQWGTFLGGHSQKLSWQVFPQNIPVQLRGTLGFHHLRPIKSLKDSTNLEKSPHIPDKDEQSKLNAYDMGSLGRCCVKTNTVWWRILLHGLGNSTTRHGLSLHLQMQVKTLSCERKAHEKSTTCRDAVKFSLNQRWSRMSFSSTSPHSRCVRNHTLLTISYSLCREQG